ncbi:glyoxalase [Comamonas serinivorans]|uniref:Glyoxalase n=1 Tax=Comamonas serinivorans TaxID=1082851 RepID=A0A1Y0EM11_9BURK|nr:glyoxalase [Comamonas serinivorans]ARU04481.1 glyoxalase [Comamonas serinivorans]
MSQLHIHAINHVQLPFPVGEEDSIRHFYGELLGLHELLPAAGRGLRFLAGSQRIDLVPTTAGAGVSGAAHLALEVCGLPQLRWRLIEGNCQLIENQALPGYLRFYVKDPAGNQLEFLEPDESQYAMN